MVKVSHEENLKKSDVTLEDKRKLTVLTLLNLGAFLIQMGTIVGTTWRKVDVAIFDLE